MIWRSQWINCTYTAHCCGISVPPMLPINDHNSPLTVILLPKKGFQSEKFKPRWEKESNNYDSVWSKNPAACSGLDEENLKVMNNICRLESGRALTLSADLKPVRSSESRCLSFGICFLSCSPSSLLVLSLSLSADWVFGIQNLWWKNKSTHLNSFQVLDLNYGFKWKDNLFSFLFFLPEFCSLTILSIIMVQQSPTVQERWLVR